MSKVIVTADAAGNVIVPSKNNTDWGHIRVTQDRMVVDDNGFARKKNLSALIVGKISDLKGFGYKKDQEIEGKIIFKESLEPFNTSDPERDYKKAGKTGIICCQDGQPIYRKNFYKQDGESMDVCVEHTNGDDIKVAYAAMKEAEVSTGGENIGDI
jgi:hypothetical protein